MLAPPPNDVPSHLSITLDVVDKVTKILAVFIGGVWAYLNYIRGRTFKRRLEPNVSGKTITKGKVSFLSGLAQVKNVGLSRVGINQRGTAITIAVLVLEETEASPPRLSEKETEVRPVFKSHGWIEPGEQIQESFFTLVPEGSRSVALHVRLRIVSDGIEWNGDSTIELTPGDWIVPAKPVDIRDLSMLRLQLGSDLPSYERPIPGTFQNKEDDQKTEEIEAKKKHT